MTPKGHLVAVNFRDPAHPEAGGAELHLEHILLEAVARGWRVTWLASGFPGGAPNADHRGIRVMRRGAWWSFNLVAPVVLRRELAWPPPDLIVEDINKAPCLLPWWTGVPVGAIVPHLFGATAFQEAPAPVALYVVLLESLIPLAYRRSRFVVISESTRDDLIQRGIESRRIAVAHCGLDHATYRLDPAVPKISTPTILFVGRLRRYKGVDKVMRALPAVRAKVPEVRLVVIGDGPFGDALKRQATRLGVADAVEFRGFVPSEQKVRAMREAWVLVQPSPKEGWGLTVIEAGACGTAVVAADSPGLRDAVRDGVTGLLFPFHDDQRFADALVRVLTDATLRNRLGLAGMEWSRRFDWSRCAAQSLDFLTGEPAGAAR